MAHAPEVRNAVRRSYVMERLPLEAACEKHDVSYNTGRIWKRKAKEEGDDWDKSRAASRMAAGGLGDMTTQVLEEFALLFQSTMEQIGEADVSALDKAEAMSRLADAYTKTMKAAGGGDSKMGQLAVAMDVLKRMTEFVQSRCPQHAVALSEILEPFGEELSRAYS